MGYFQVISIGPTRENAMSKTKKSCKQKKNNKLAYTRFIICIGNECKGSLYKIQPRFPIRNSFIKYNHQTWLKIGSDFYIKSIIYSLICLWICGFSYKTHYKWHILKTHFIKKRGFQFIQTFFWTNLIPTINSIVEVFPPNMVAVSRCVWGRNGAIWSILVPFGTFWYLLVYFGILLLFIVWSVVTIHDVCIGDFFQRQCIYIVCSYTFVLFSFPT